jgi:hypothetical protein
MKNNFSMILKQYPCLLIFIYFILVGLDLLLTYLGTPDLKYEGNWIIRHFHLSWTQIIIMMSVNAIILAAWLLIGQKMARKYFVSNPVNTKKHFVLEVIRSWKLIISLYFMGSFYAHLFTTIYICGNNYLSYVYLLKIDNLFSGIATAYINFELASGPLFFTMIKGPIIIGGFIFAYLKMKNTGIASRILNDSQTVSK